MENYSSYFEPGHQNDDTKQKTTPLFAADPDTDNDSALHSFYHDASHQAPSHEPPTPVFSQLSQLSNLSVAELSRMEESVQESLLSASAHHDAEVDRQKEKEKRKRKRREATVLKERKKYILSAEQIQRGAMYRRFKYEKSIDISDEQDVGGSMEYLVRRKLSEPEQQRRLMRVAKERLAQQEEIEEEGLEDVVKMDMDDEADGKLDSSEAAAAAAAAAAKIEEQKAASKSEPNWNFLQEGYVTMPRRQSKDLPYYIYNISNQTLGKRKVDECEKSESKNESNEDETDSKATNSSKGSATDSVRSKKDAASVSSKQHRKKQFKWDTTSSSFPLHYNQLNPKMDLRSFSLTNSQGQDGMALLHGRIAKRLWARLVAGGVTCSMLNDYNQNKSDDAKNTVKQEEEPASDMSHSSDSSESFGAADIYGGSDYRSQFNSQTFFGSSLIRMDTDHVDDVNEACIEHNNPVIRLMSLVHTLPSFTHRNRFYIKIATELGTLRQLWENDFKQYLEPEHGNLDEQINISPSELSFVKSFFGVDGSIPFWCCDPSMPTDVTKFKQRMQKSRMKLIPRLRRLIEDSTRGRPGKVIIGVSNAGGLKEESLFEEKQDGDLLASSQVDMSMNETTHDLEEIKDEDNPDLKIEVEDTSEMPVEGNTDEYMPELSRSLLDTIKLGTTPGDVDRYAKVVHEANFDVTNIGISLSSLINELTASQAQAYHLQQLNFLSPIERGTMRTFMDNAGMWNAKIDEYLTLAENESRPLDMNLNKRGGKVPQCSALAHAVSAHQAYVSNGGGIGCKSRKKNNQISSRLSQIKEEDEEDSYESNEGEQIDFSSEVLAQKELDSIKLSATALLNRGKEYLAIEHLQLFTPIHLTTGIAMLVENLTPIPTEILSRPCTPDNTEDRTPFDLMRKVLTSLEERGELISRPSDTESIWAAKGKVIDEVLVKSWENAVLIFRRCIEADPHNLDNWTWYVATLLGIVCVGSSLPLSSTAEESDDDSTNSRYMLEFYGSYASRAMNDFIHVSDTVDCPMFHMAISTMFEWRQALLLISKSQLSQLSDCDFSDSEVRRLIAHHTYQWAVKDCSEISISKVQKMYQSRELALDKFLNVLALSVEADPSNTAHWYRLVDTIAATRNAQIYNNIKNESDGDNKLDECKWRHRRQEWRQNFFQSPPSSASMVKPEFVSIVLNALDSDILSAKKTSTKTKAASSFTTSPEHSVKENLSSDPMCEALCLRIVVAHHLFGDSDFVCNSIWWLAVKQWKSNKQGHTTNIYLLGLKWLSSHGFDVLEYIKMRHNTSL